MGKELECTEESRLPPPMILGAEDVLGHVKKKSEYSATCKLNSLPLFTHSCGKISTQCHFFFSSLLFLPQVFIVPLFISILTLLVIIHHHIYIFQQLCYFFFLVLQHLIRDLC